MSENGTGVGGGGGGNEPHFLTPPLERGCWAATKTMARRAIP